MFFIKENNMLKVSENKEFFTEGMSFGYGVFETIKIKNRKILFLKEHLYRLENSLKKIEMKNIVDKIKIKENIVKLLNKNKLNNCAIKIIVTKDSDESNIFISTREYSYGEDEYKKGFSLIETDVRRSTTSIIPTIKSINYMENIIERNKAIAKDYKDVLFYNDKNYLSETAIGNIFIVKNNIVYTPDVNQGLLNGIIREKVLDILKLEKIHFLEKAIKKEEVDNSEEIFITNSLIGVMPVSKIGNKRYLVAESSLTNKIRNKYMELEEKYE